jgi:peptide deformylase
MSAREVILVPHPTLRKKAEPVKDFGPELQGLIDDMVETMQLESGVGLAAPQVNISQQVIVIEFGSEEEEELPPELYILVNPKITRFSTDVVLGAEGCLSIPGLMGEVERAYQVTIEGQDRSGSPVTLHPEGWLARVFQHEIDHLNGILYTDRATQVWKTDEDFNPV